MANEDLLEQILLIRPEVSREELLERLEGERAKTGGLISGETLLRVIAAEFGVDFSNAKRSAPTLLIHNLIPNLNDITVVGRVVAVFSPRSFKGKRSGKFASLLVADKSGLLRVVMWNDQTILIESGEVTVGQVIRLSHGYTKEDRGGRVELHIGRKCQIAIDPRDILSEDYPTIDQFVTKIGEINLGDGNKRINVLGTVRRLFPTSVFQREDSSSGKVLRFVLADETGEMCAVAWNERVDELEKMLKKGVSLQIVHGRVKKAAIGSFEIHIDGGASAGIAARVKAFLKIGDLKEGLSHVDIEGQVVADPVIREVKTVKGELVKLAAFELKDETGKIRFSAWREQADMASGFKLGDKIIVKDAYVKKGFGEGLEASTMSTTSLTKAV